MVLHLSLWSGRKWWRIVDMLPSAAISRSPSISTISLVFRTFTLILTDELSEVQKERNWWPQRTIPGGNGRWIIEYRSVQWTVLDEMVLSCSSLLSTRRVFFSWSYVWCYIKKKRVRSRYRELEIVDFELVSNNACKEGIESMPSQAKFHSYKKYICLERMRLLIIGDNFYPFEEKDNIW